MAYKVIEADSAEKLTQLVVADGQGAIGGVAVVPADSMNRTRFFQAVGPAAGGGAEINNGDTVAVVNSAGADSHDATATVTAGSLTNVKLAATVAMVDQGDTVTVQNSTGAAVAGTHTATVAAGVVSNVKLAATIAPVANGAALTVPVTGTYTTTAIVSVANGVVTGIVLS